MTISRIDTIVIRVTVALEALKARAATADALNERIQGARPAHDKVLLQHRKAVDSAHRALVPAFRQGAAAAAAAAEALSSAALALAAAERAVLAPPLCTQYAEAEATVASARIARAEYTNAFTTAVVEINKGVNHPDEAKRQEIRRLYAAGWYKVLAEVESSWHRLPTMEHPDEAIAYWAKHRGKKPRAKAKA
jgi:hypothetical protein